MILGSVLLAAGTGARFGADIPKQFIPLNGRPVWQYSYDVIKNHADVENAVVMFPPGYITGPHADAITGGHTRRESSYLGVKALLSIRPDITHILIHDAARPFITKKIIDDCIDALEDGYDAVDVTIKSADSIARLDDSGRFIEEIPDRSKMRLGQTPQCFKAKMILEAMETAPSDLQFTDDIGILLYVMPGSKVKNVEGEEDNMKITTVSDLIKAERIANKILQKPNQDLSGKRALVLGASGGIGTHVCNELRKRGVSDILTPSTRDLTPNEVAQKVYHAVDIVIDCIGQLTKENFFTSRRTKWLDEFSVNFLTQIEIMERIIAEGKMRNDSCFIFVGSSSAYHGRPGYSAYSSAKAALMNFVQAVGSEVSGLRINLVNPGRCNTPMRKKMFGNEEEDTLVSPEQVASKIVDVCGLSCSGAIFDIRANEIDT